MEKKRKKIVKKSVLTKRPAIKRTDLNRTGIVGGRVAQVTLVEKLPEIPTEIPTERLVEKFTERPEERQAEKTAIKPAEKTAKRSRLVFGTMIALIVVANFAAVFFYFQWRGQKNSGGLSENRRAEVLSALGKLMVLPSDEDPTIAKVTDLDTLKDEPFFARAKNGDTVIIYARAKKAILFRESENKIIDVAPVNFSKDERKDGTLDDAGATQTASTTESAGSGE